MLLNLLESYGSNVAVVEGGRRWSGRELLVMAERLARKLKHLRLNSVLLATDKAAEIIVALASCEIARATVLLAPSTLGDSQVETVLQNGVQAMLRLSDGQLTPVLTARCSEGYPDVFKVALMTSGTSGHPKIALHDFSRLLARVRQDTSAPKAWLLTYTPTAFAGVQVILTALASSSLLACPTSRDLNEVIPFAVENKITHASGTPTLWRTWLLASASFAVLPNLEQITLGGEAVDQITLDRLSATYPEARQMFRSDGLLAPVRALSKVR